MRIQLSDHFTYGKLLRFIIPSVIMMIVTSVYGVVDGFFVSNFVGKTPFAAINLIFPLFMMLGAIGFMLGTGGAAIVGKTLGEGKEEKANKYFSMFIYVIFAGGTALMILAQIFLRPISMLIGAEGELLEYCVKYGRIMLLSLPFFMLQFAFQTLFVTAEKPTLGLIVTVFSGIANIILDAVFILGFGWGVQGAAAATAASEFVGGFVPLVYFLRKNDSLLRLCKTGFYGKIFLRGCMNGVSEFCTEISASLVTVLYNWQLLRLAGENGVAAYGVIMYVAFIFSAMYIGYTMGCAPLVSYNYGAENHDELKNVFKKSIKIMAILGVSLMLLAEFLAKPLAMIFVSYDEALLQLTVHGLRIHGLAFILSGLNMFGSSFFTALNNGLLSAIISISRILLFQCSLVIILPMIFGIDGIWCAVAVAECCTICITSTLLIKNRARYHYA